MFFFYTLHKELHRIYLHLSYFTRFPFYSSRQYCQISFIKHIAFSFNKETKNTRSVLSDDMFPYQRMITYVTGLFYNRISHRQKHISYISQDSLSITVDRYLLWIALEFPLIKIHEKGAKCDKICFSIE